VRFQFLGSQCHRNALAAPDRAGELIQRSSNQREAAESRGERKGEKRSGKAGTERGNGEKSERQKERIVWR